MGLFSARQSQREPAPDPWSVLRLGTVHGWADTFLRMAGMEPAAIDQVRETYPTDVPGPNLDLTFDAGTPSNPWILAVACAEGAIADALQVYLYAGRGFLTQRQATSIYAEAGLQGLAAAIVARERAVNLQWVHEVIDEKIQESFSNMFERMITHYLRDFWPTQKRFSVRVAP